MQPLPTSWPAPDAPVAVLPTVYAIFEGASWPPAREECPAGTVKLSSWSIQRSLTGGLLPGQVRGATGMSIGRGSIEFAQPDGDTLAPWRAGALGIPTGVLSIRVVAGYDGPTGDVVTLGTFAGQVRAGSLAGATVSLDLLEESTRLRAPLTLPTVISTPAYQSDPAFVIDQAARSVGKFSTPPPVASAIFSAPFTGATTPEIGEGGIFAVTWGQIDGQIAGQGVNEVPLVGANATGIALPTSGSTNTFYLAMTITAEARVTVTVGGVARILVVDPVSAMIGMIGGTGRSWVPGRSSVHPHRVEIKLDVSRSGTTMTVTAAARSLPSDAFSSSSTNAVTISTGATTCTISTTVTEGALSALQIATTTDPGMWSPPTARIEPSGAIVEAIVLPPVTDAWATIQWIAAATLGAAWLTAGGRLEYHGPAFMRGSQPSVEQIPVMRRLTDLPWTIDPSDAADRVEVTWTPPAVQRVTDHSVLVWEATEVVTVLPGQTVEVVADIEGAAANLAPWATYDPGTTTYPTTGSLWVAADAASGGARVTSGITITAATSGSQVRISITNTGPVQVWMVDASGSPVLILRANILARAGEQQSLSTGVDEALAATPVTLDLGPWCGTVAGGQEVLDWLTEQTGAPRWRADDVEVLAHLGRELGDVADLDDARTDLAVRAMLTGITLSGGSGGITQTLSLAVLEEA